MPQKINISTSDGKTWKIEIDSEVLTGKKLGDTIKGQEISADMSGYEFIIAGGSDIAGFPHKADVEGAALKRVLLKKGWGMHAKKKGLRLRKTVRGMEISEKTVQINLKTEKIGNKQLNEIFPDQNKAPEPPAPAETEKPAEQTQEVAPAQ